MMTVINMKFEDGRCRISFEDLHIDLVGPLPPSEGNTYLLPIIDRSTLIMVYNGRRKMSLVPACCKLPKISLVARCL